jgi:hypothetical protein
VTAPPNPSADPLAVVESLDGDRIRAAMDELDERRRALSVLLRAAVVRERAARRRQEAASRAKGGTDHAA